MSRRLKPASVLLLVPFCFAALASAQGTAEDYRRAAGLEARWRAAFKATKPSSFWLDDGRLLLEGLGDGPDGPVFRAVDPASGAETTIALDDPLLRIGKTEARRRGDATVLYVRNRTEAPLELFWQGGDGDRSYGTIKAGGERVQPTFGGHRWILRRADRTDSGLFAAEDRPCVAEIAPDGTLLRRPPPPPAAKTSSRPVVGSGISPDGKRRVAFREEPGDVGKLRFVESAPDGTLKPRLREIDYARPGDRITVRKPQLFDTATGREIPIDDALFRDPYAITEAAWSADGAEYRFVYNARGHQTLRLVAIDAETGRARTLIEETSPTFVDYAHGFYFRILREGRTALWMSERDGFRHLYRFDLRTGKMLNRVTTGPWVVRGVESVDEDKARVYFRAGGIRPEEDPYHVHYARVDLDGTDLVVLTAGDGTHEIDVAPDGGAFLDRWSRVDLPPRTVLRRREDGREIRIVAEGDDAALKAAGWTPPERFKAKGVDGATDIYGVIFRPSNFDPSKRYPVIEHVYAGPQGFFTPKSFAAWHHHREVAELGFIVVQVDGRGTAGRSKAFHDVAWRNVAEAGFDDRIAWLKAAAATRPEMDLSRVGIYGTSAGGQTAFRALITHGDFYRAAVADCGCHDNRTDKLWWNELWMGYPVGPHYDEQSNAKQAHRMKGDLFLIVGESDRNVDPASTLQVVDALVKADKDFELLVMPGVGHGVLGTPYGKRRMQDFFVRKLLGVEPRAR